MTINIRVDGRRACAAVSPPRQPVTAGSAGILAAFDLSADYDGLVVTAVFRSANATRDVILDEGRAPVVVPWEVLEQPAAALYIGVVGADGSGNIIIPTVWANVGTIVPAAKASGVSPSDPSVDIGTQIVAQARAAAQDAAESAAEAEGYAGDAEAAKDAAEAAQRAAEAAQDASETAQGKAEAAQEAAEDAALHYPKIVNDYWYVWDVTSAQYVNTGVKAKGEDGQGAVQSVNGKTGDVILDAEDVGALPDDTPIPSKTSDLTNDSGFVNAAGAAAAAPVQSVNGKSGAVSLSASDVGAGTYSKPAGGIPASDMAQAVQTSLGKADTALQAVPITYRTASAQDVIDAGKQGKITASGIIKGDGSGNVSGAVPGTDYVAPSEYNPESKTAAMTQAVGKDASGKLWTEPGGGGGSDVPLSVVNGKICITFEEVS